MLGMDIGRVLMFLVMRNILEAFFVAASKLDEVDGSGAFLILSRKEVASAAVFS
jgi:hypothetical protein